jgi:cholinesterase
MIPNIMFANLTAAGLDFFSDLGQIGDRFSEDCLTLDVWVPSGGESKKAVMVWIYGGGFSAGSADVATDNGQNLASQGDVIVVSMKYGGFASLEHIS